MVNRGILTPRGGRVNTNVMFSYVAYSRTRIYVRRSCSDPHGT